MVSAVCICAWEEGVQIDGHVKKLQNDDKKNISVKILNILLVSERCAV